MVHLRDPDGVGDLREWLLLAALWSSLCEAIYCEACNMWLNGPTQLGIYNCDVN